VHPNSRYESLLIWNTNHALRCYRNPVSSPSEGIRKIEDVALLAADVRWKELG